MRRPRILGEDSHCYYHVISRVIERRLIFGPQEREVFRKVMRRQAAFSGVRVVTWTCLSNHFHMLVALDSRKDRAQQKVLAQLMENDREFLARLRNIYDAEVLSEVEKGLQRIRCSDATGEYNAKQRAKLKQPYLDRMYDLASFVGELKQRLSQWYNKCNDRKGPLWEDRFKSVLVQGSSGVLALVAAYIDLNAVRAGVVNDPRDWRWCGYAEALAAQNLARCGIFEALGEPESTWRDGISWKRAHQRYRAILMHGALQRRDERGRVIRKGISREEFASESGRDFELPSPVLLHQRIRYFVDGVALGSAAFVEGVFGQNKHKLHLKRKTGARIPKAAALGDLRTLTDLRPRDLPD